jgi:sentrin-specific protease 8
MGDEGLLLTFHTSNVYDSDLRLLTPPNWLNDHIIGFAFDYFEHVLFNDRRLKFISPGTTFIIMHENDLDDLEHTVLGAGIKADTRFIFFPVNDNTNMRKVGGSHWALLVFDGDTKKFYFYDSYHKGNLSSAQRLASQVAPFLLPARYSISDKDRKANKLPASLKTNGVQKDDLVACVSPQQSNSYDCGVYTVAVAEALAAGFLSITRSKDRGDSTSSNTSSTSSTSSSTGTSTAASSSTKATLNLQDASMQKSLFEQVTPSAMQAKRKQLREYIDKAVLLQQTQFLETTANANASKRSSAASTSTSTSTATSEECKTQATATAATTASTTTQRQQPESTSTATFLNSDKPVQATCSSHS